MRPSLEYIKEKFDYFNKLCFEGKLPIPPIRLNMRYGEMGLTRFRRTVTPEGLLHYEDISIEISIRRDLPEEEYIDTLIHEMIHYYIAVNDIIDDSPHGKVFCNMMNYITKKFGIGISIAFTPDEEYLVNTISHLRYICVADFEDERMGIAVVAKNKIFELWEIFPLLKGVKEVRWYISNRSIFEKFPITVSPRLIIVDADKIQHYLTGAQELYIEGNKIKVKK